MSVSDEDGVLIERVLGSDGMEAIFLDAFTTEEVSKLLTAIRSQPIPITDEMVERACRGVDAYNRFDHPAPNSIEGARHNVMRAALQAALQKDNSDG